MTNDAFKDRGRAFETHYFNKLSDEKAKALKEKLQRNHDLQELQKDTGITDTRLLQAVLDHGISASELTSLTLFPVAYVAWADGKIDEKERNAVFKACKEFGISQNTATMDLMESWLEHPVEEEMLTLWSSWIQEALKHMEPEHAKGFAMNIKNKAHAVATSSRSFLGLGAQISHKEKEALDHISSILHL
ncbi:MAG: hypothetical protein KDD46_02100 [Bdellovibrionales bacterium]|nr:hypothetical protein [Bdellovibrionales bacterium]